MENTTQNKFEIGAEVVRSKGDYVVGRIGKVIALDTEKNRAQVEWTKTFRGFPVQQRWNEQTQTWNIVNLKSWVNIDVIEPTSTPYEILEPKPTCPRTGRMFNQTYRRLA